ncbi:hypothetical protein [Mycolicibacterium goodii]|uniref:hypothetical protein n=1 Tax=Mycolicibacterium goodii TaxID=134601 RepID=UPI001BDD9C48|nr:hypothetical protein [Mycolicibacterium goodii]MBU8839071.1 hypothetical protein [Mycolicibacterium goodii]
MTYEAPRTAEQARALYERLCSEMGEGRVSAQTVRCWICKHSVHAHFSTVDGAGCVADGPAPLTLPGAFDGETPGAAHIAGAAGCLCPGFTTGGLPHGMTKHMDGLDAHDDELCPNPSCEHDLLRHGGGVDFDGQPYGCWACPCDVNELPTNSLFKIRIDVAAADTLSTPDVTAAHGTELLLEGGWLARLQPDVQGAVTMQIWQRDGLQFRSGGLDTNDAVWAGLSRYETAEVTTTITDCWWHENECDPDHEYRMRLIADA